MKRDMSREELAAYKEGYKDGRKAQHFEQCGWCRLGLACPYGYVWEVEERKRVERERE